MHDQFAGDEIVLENALAYWIHRVYQATRGAMYTRFRASGEEITPEQWIVLVRLWQQDGRTQTELGAATFHDRPTMSRIVDVMERRGLVERRADPENARARRVHLTRRGKALRKTLVPLARALVGDVQRGISRKDLEVTRATLMKMFANVERA